MTITNWAGQRISGQLYEDIYYYGGNQVTVFYGFNGNLNYNFAQTLPIPITITLEFNI